MRSYSQQEIVKLVMGIPELKMKGKHVDLTCVSSHRSFLKMELVKILKDHVRQQLLLMVSLQLRVNLLLMVSLYLKKNQPQY